MNKKLGGREILGETFALVKENQREVLIYTAAIGGATALGSLAGLTETVTGAVGFGAVVSAENGLAAGLFDLVLAVAGIVGIYWLAKTFLRSRRSVVQDENRFWPYVGMSILSAIGLVIGFLLLIVPGIILMVRWSAATGFLLSGREGVIDSLKASWETTRGNGLKIFLAGLVLFIGMAIAIGIVTGIFGAVSSSAGQVVGALLEALVNAVLPAFGIAIYCMLENSGEKLEEVFS
jgi:hypothetical protein